MQTRVAEISKQLRKFPPQIQQKGCFQQTQDLFYAEYDEIKFSLLNIKEHIILIGAIYLNFWFCVGYFAEIIENLEVGLRKETTFWHVWLMLMGMLMMNYIDEDDKNTNGCYYEQDIDNK